MGKTASGAVWLDPNKTSPFDFYQYWRNVSDNDVMKCIRMLTFLPLETIDEMKDWKDAKLNDAKDILAYELTKLVHGEEEAEKARASSRALFGGAEGGEIPTVTLSDGDLTDGGIDILSALVKAGLCASRSEARRAVEQGGATLDNEKVTDIRFLISKDTLSAGCVLRRGKKSYKKIILN